MPPPERVGEEENSDPLDLLASCPITLTRAALDGVNVEVDNTTISVVDFTFDPSQQEKTLALKPTLLKSSLITLPRVTEVTQEGVVEPKIENSQPRERPPGEMLGNLLSHPILPEMTDVYLSPNLNIEELKDEQLRVTGDTDITVNTMLLKMNSIDGNTKLDALDIDSSQRTVNASGTAQPSDGWLMGIILSSTLNVEPLKGERVKLKVGDTLREQMEIGANPSGPVDMDLHTQAQLAEVGLPLNVGVSSKQFYWPFTGKKQYQAGDLKLKLTGKMTDYMLSMRTTVEGQEIPPATITLDAKGNGQQVNFGKLIVVALGGKTELKALPDWQQAISRRSELTFNGINTAKEISRWPSKLNGLTKTRGSLYDSTWQVGVPELKLAGNVRQNKMNVDGTPRGNDYMQWIVPRLHPELGPSSTEVKGELGVEDLSLDIIVNAPGLDNALPRLGGTTKGLVKIRGVVEAPRLPTDITAHGLYWQGLSVAQVHVESDIKSTDQIVGKFDVRVE